jgi:tetratricopeptide (TPR) repeat protein
MKNWQLLFLIFPIIAMAQTNFDKAKALFDDQKFQASITFFENDLKENPNSLRTIELLGDVYGHLQNWDKALSYYQKLKNTNPNNADYWYKFGGVLGMKAKTSNKFVALGLIGDVKKAFETAIKLNPKHIDARWALVEIYLQLPGIVGGSESKAKKYANELQTISPVDGFLAKGRIAEYFERYKTAEEQYLKAFQIGKSKTSFQKLYDLYTKKLKQPEKAAALKKDLNSEI